MPAQLQPQLTPEEYLAIEREAETKSEFFGGVMYAMAGGSMRHSAISANLIGALQNALRGRPCQVFTSDLRVKLDESGDYAYPDISALCGEPIVEGDDLLLNPALIMEVLSPSTQSYDKTRKFFRYQALSALSEYVLVEQTTAAVIRLNRQPDGSWNTRFINGLEAELELLSVGVKIPFAAIYENIAFLAKKRGG